LKNKLNPTIFVNVLGYERDICPLINITTKIMLAYYDAIVFDV